MIETWKIAGGILEYIDETHTYIYDGVILPSITQMLKSKFGNKYNGVDKRVLKRAADKGTEVHKSIENYEKKNIDNPECIELRNYKFLKKQFGFKCRDNEVPIVLFFDGKPVSAGRIDLILEYEGKVGIADIKRTSVFDKEYVAFQTNLYRIGYQQSYNVDISFLRGIHLRDKVRKYIELPIKEEMVTEFLKNYLMEEEYE
ncbi:MAG: hypothetical protein ACLTKT_00885 [Clostridia bacterium]|jgi:hypothetical protein|nr:hypothetical protein [Clostridium sp.]DAE58923.1 MAG TPA: exonuclease [Caudoviricetes sp.]